VRVWGEEAEKYDINFGLRITLVNANCPFYFSYIMTFVIEFSRNNHVSDFQSLVSLPYSVLVSHPHHVHKDQLQSRLGEGATAPFANPWKALMLVKHTTHNTQ